MSEEDKMGAFVEPVEGGFSYELAAKLVFEIGHLKDAGAPSVGEHLCVILEWDGVDQQELRGEVVSVENEDRIGILLSGSKTQKTYTGIMVRGRPELAASSTSRSSAAWRLLSLVDAKS
jgi:hypothetical protein